MSPGLSMLDSSSFTASATENPAMSPRTLSSHSKNTQWTEAEAASRRLLASQEYPSFTYLLPHFDHEGLTYLRDHVMPILTLALESSMKQLVAQQIQREIAEREHTAAVNALRRSSATSILAAQQMVATTTATATTIVGSTAAASPLTASILGPTQQSLSVCAAAAPESPSGGAASFNRRKSQAAVTQLASSLLAMGGGPTTGGGASGSVRNPPDGTSHGAADAAASHGPSAAAMPSSSSSSSLAAGDSNTTGAKAAVHEAQKKAHSLYAVASTMRYLKRGEKTFRTRPVLPTAAVMPVPPGTTHPIRLLAEELKRRGSRSAMPLGSTP